MGAEGPSVNEESPVRFVWSLVEKMEGELLADDRVRENPGEAVVTAVGRAPNWKTPVPGFGANGVEEPVTAAIPEEKLKPPRPLPPSAEIAVVTVLGKLKETGAVVVIVEGEANAKQLPVLLTEVKFDEF